MRNHDFISKKVCLCGRSGRGKSTYQRQLVNAWPADFVFIFDHKDEFKNKAGFHQCRTWAEADAALAQFRRVNFKPLAPIETPEQLRAAFREWAGVVLNVCRELPGRKLIVADEMGQLLPKAKTDFDSHPVCIMGTTGREFGIDLLCATPRPANLLPEFRGQISQWVFFQQSLGWIGPLAEELGEDFAAVKDLQVGEWIAYDADSGEMERGRAKP